MPLDLSSAGPEFYFTSSPQILGLKEMDSESATEVHLNETERLNRQLSSIRALMSNKLKRSLNVNIIDKGDLIKNLHTDKRNNSIFLTLKQATDKNKKDDKIIIRFNDIRPEISSTEYGWTDDAPSKDSYSKPSSNKLAGGVTEKDKLENIDASSSDVKSKRRPDVLGKNPMKDGQSGGHFKTARDIQEDVSRLRKIADLENVAEAVGEKKHYLEPLKKRFISKVARSKISNLQVAPTKLLENFQSLRKETGDDSEQTAPDLKVRGNPMQKVGGGPSKVEVFQKAEEITRDVNSKGNNRIEKADEVPGDGANVDNLRKESDLDAEQAKESVNLREYPVQKNERTPENSKVGHFRKASDADAEYLRQSLNARDGHEKIVDEVIGNRVDNFQKATDDELLTQDLNARDGQKVDQVPDSVAFKVDGFRKSSGADALVQDSDVRGNRLQDVSEARGNRVLDNFQTEAGTDAEQDINVRENQRAEEEDRVADSKVDEVQGDTGVDAEEVRQDLNTREFQANQIPRFDDFLKRNKALSALLFREREKQKLKEHFKSDFKKKLLSRYGNAMPKNYEFVPVLPKSSGRNDGVLIVETSQREKNLENKMNKLAETDGVNVGNSQSVQNDNSPPASPIGLGDDVVVSKDARDEGNVGLGNQIEESDKKKFCADEGDEENPSSEQPLEIHAITIVENLIFGVSRQPCDGQKSPSSENEGANALQNEMDAGPMESSSNRSCTTPESTKCSNSTTECSASAEESNLPPSGCNGTAAPSESTTSPCESTAANNNNNTNLSCQSIDEDYKDYDENESNCTISESKDADVNNRKDSQDRGGRLQAQSRNAKNLKLYICPQPSVSHDRRNQMAIGEKKNFLPRKTFRNKKTTVGHTSEVDEYFDDYYDDEEADNDKKDKNVRDNNDNSGKDVSYASPKEITMDNGRINTLEEETAPTSAIEQRILETTTVSLGDVLHSPQPIFKVKENQDMIHVKGVNLLSDSKNTVTKFLEKEGNEKQLKNLKPLLPASENGEQISFFFKFAILKNLFCQVNAT